jgi:hypothetical protein
MIEFVAVKQYESAGFTENFGISEARSFFSGKSRRAVEAFAV